MTSVDSNFNFLCGRPHGAGPPPPVHLSLTPSTPPCGRHKWMAPRAVYNCTMLEDEGVLQSGAGASHTRTKQTRGVGEQVLL